MRCGNTRWYSFLEGTTLHLISPYQDFSCFSGLNIFVGCPIQFAKGKGFFVCDVRVAAHTQNCPKNGPLKARLMA